MSIAWWHRFSAPTGSQPGKGGGHGSAVASAAAALMTNMPIKASHSPLASAQIRT